MSTNMCSSCNAYAAGGKCNRFTIVMKDSVLKIDECSILHVKTKKNDTCPWYSDADNVTHVSLYVTLPTKLEDKLDFLRHVRKWAQGKPRIQEVIAFVESTKQVHQGV